MQYETCSFALHAVIAPADLVTTSGEAGIARGDTLLAAGQSLPRSLSVMREYNDLGIAFIEVEGEGDPGDVPKQFTVEVSMGKQAGDTSSRNYRFDQVGRGSMSGSQRRFTFPLAPLDLADVDLDGTADFDGTFVHFVRLTIFDSDYDAAELLGEGEAGMVAYEALREERRGRRVFQRITAGNFLKRVRPILGDDGSIRAPAEQVYNDSLEVGERGPILYFRRELPRVAEIEVWGPGPNVAYRPERHAGAGFEDGGKGTPLKATDGVYLTKWLGNPWVPEFSSGFAGHEQLLCCTMWLDLGATFWIDRIALGMIPTRENWVEGTIYGWDLLGSDGTARRALDLQTPADFTQLEHGLAWTDLVSEINKDNNTPRVRMMAEAFQLRKLRFFQQRNRDPAGRVQGGGVSHTVGHFNELQMYGHGYPAELSLQSPAIILLPGVREEDAGSVRERRVLSEIRWQAEAIVREADAVAGQAIERAVALEEHPEVDLRIQTRSSDTIDSLYTYYQVTGAGTASERRVQVDVVEYESLVELWERHDAYQALPEAEVFTLRNHSAGDDDGDGRIDEDPIDGIDNDGDRRIDEDGLDGDEGGPQAIRGPVTVTITKHQRRQDDDGDGQEDEDPIDGADNDGDLLIDEDGKRVAKPRQEAGMLITPFFAGWSAWSAPYGQAEDGEFRADITSPSPRKFLQVRVTIVSDDPDVTARMRSLRVDLAPPISTDLAGELAVLTDHGLGRPLDELVPTRLDYHPPREIEPLTQTPYAFFVRAAGPDPNVAAASAGFDELLLLTPSRAQLTGVRLGRIAVEDPPGSESAADRRAVATVFERVFLPTAGDSIFRDRQDPLLVHGTSDSLLVRFPFSVNAGLRGDENAIVELRFRAQTLTSGSEFLARARNSAESSVSQRVEAEGRDATELVDSGTARPEILQDGRIVGDVRMAKVFSPNSDGVNDLLEIEFTVLLIRDQRPVEVAFHDLSGRRLAVARPGSGTDMARSGVARFEWDGTDEVGQLVPPGIYIARLRLATDSGDVTAMRTVNVVY